MGLMDIIYDMETSDPDDAAALMLLCAHQDVRLLAVTITPGTPAQVGLVKNILRECDKRIPVGSFNPYHQKICVSEFWSKTFEHAIAEQPDALGWEIFEDALERSPNLTLVTGAPLKNCGDFLKHSKLKIKRWVG